MQPLRTSESTTADESTAAGAALPVLARRGELAERIDRQRVAAAAALSGLLTRISARTDELMPATEATERRIDKTLEISRRSLHEAHEAIRTAMVEKYQFEYNWNAYQPNSYEVVAGDASAWLAEAEATLGSIQNAGFQFTRVRRMEVRHRLVTLAQISFNEFPSALSGVEATAANSMAALYESAFTDFRGRVNAAVAQNLTHFTAVEAPGVAPVLPEAGPCWQAAEAEAIEPSVSRLLCPIGLVRPTRIQLDTALEIPDPPGGVHTHRFGFALDGVPEIPALLDLDECGGLVTDDAAVVENLTLDLLAALPAGRLVIDVVDPAQVGASLNFLYGLGEAGEKIYGQKVWTAHNVGELLAELENHVAFVTQKYLQGTHETLTDYNRAAGEVAEPYRLLLLFDHPQAFTRDGKSYDDEAFARLERLATVGRRAGVLIAATVRDRNTRGLGALATAFTRGEDGALVTRLGLPRGVAATRFVRESSLEWQLHPYPRPTDRTRAAVLAHVERTLAKAADTRVDPGRVAELADAAAQRAAATSGDAVETVADPRDPRTWWRGAVEDRVVARFGRAGAAGVAELRLDSVGASSALIGGRTGSGKSVLLHSIILGFALQYAPPDLEFYLIDFKEGVEFKPYATGALPHAKVVAVETNRDFGISVLESLDAEIARRGMLFKNAAQGQLEIGRYRRATGDRLPRIVLVIDEFHMLLEQDDSTSTRGAELLDRIIRQGRAFGVHTLLASQSVSGGGQKIRTALNQIPIRLVLASSTQDSELLLAEGNSDAQLLSKPGEGIINTHGGLREANNRFQCAYWSTELRAELIDELRSADEQAGRTGKPVVFEGDVPVAVEDFAPELFTESQPTGTLRLPIGAPMSLAPPVTVQLERQPGNNVLVVAQSALGVLAIAVAALLAAGVRVDYLDFAAVDARSEDTFTRLRAAGAQANHRRKLGDVLDALRTEITERTELDDYAAPARVLVLIGVHRARELSPDSFDPDSESGRLADVLRRGPEVGVHVIAWGDRNASLERRFDHEGFRQFGHKVLGTASEDDSRTLIDSEVASSLSPNQLAVDDYDNARTTIVRRFDEPSPAWFDRLLTPGSDDRG
ncbi:FtsK/SpoIIIE domain-containing protein [Nocardia sp. BMG111209]|uniref:FtsK/SpoIIIE domain-containing protein n=1 Tax=Nocardia sp. BMG111209 TaxID=1160137 RepID=UPI0003621F78|nr:FtsK/SpoIIIE domain-containing protein [Nocardia sp. BMG111209]